MSKHLFIFLLFAAPALGEEEAETDGLYDKNKDGIVDVWYEYFKDGRYIELVDSNYDSKVDQRCIYNSNNTLEHCSYDQNFDDYEETWVKYEEGQAVQEVVDIDRNQLFEIVFNYRSGILSEGFRYYSSKANVSQVGHVKFEFGYPLKEEIKNTTLTESEFSEKHLIKQ